MTVHRIGIIETLHRMSEDMVAQYFSIEGKHDPSSDPIDVLLNPNNSLWYIGFLENTKFTVNLSSGYGMHITHILLKSGDGNQPISWDVNTTVQDHPILIDSRKEDYTMITPFTKYAFEVKQQGYYNSVHVALTGENMNGALTFCLSFIDFFGILTDSTGHPIIIAPYYPLCHFTQFGDSLISFSFIQLLPMFLE